MCKDDETIYLPTFSDFRGRSLVRGLAISYQGSDPHKALLEWSEGIEADEDTEFWLMIEMTAYMAGGLDKKSFGDRCGAIHINREDIIASVRDPYGHKWWQSKDNIKKPWLWLAAAQEWVRLYVDNDSDRTTHARTSIDATCSGQQYFAGLLACKATAAQVNLINSVTPSDVYTNVLAVMMRDIEEKDGAIHAVNDDGKELGLIDKDKMDILRSADRSEIRGGVKGVVVCGQYGAGKETRIEAFIKDCDAVEFTKDEARGIYQSIKVGLNECLPAMDLILEWIQKVARESLETTGRQYLVLPAADGSTVVQRYPKMEGNGKVSLDNLGTQGYRKRRQAVSVKPTPKTDKKDQVISCAANLIHAQDGATLVLALYDYDKPFSATHDSIAGRPSKEMNDIRERLLGSLYKVFTSDVLRQFVELNGLDWEEYKAPVVGTYDPKSVLKASKAYC
jgi:DNA-directed RNA polymerase